MAISVLDVWPLSTASSGERDITGSATPQGAFIVVIAGTRDDTATLTVTDNSGTNSYTSAGSIATGSSLVKAEIFYCANAAATTQIVVSSTASVATHAGALILDGVDAGDPVDAVSSSSPSAEGGSYPVEDVTPSDGDNLVLGVAALPVTNRILEQQDGSYTDLAPSSANQLRVDASYVAGAGTSPTGPQWDLVSGSATSANLLTVAFNAGEGGGPGPLSVDAGSDQSIYVGQSASVSASASGGTSPYSYAWTVISGSGSFLNSNQASTTFTPSGGAGTRVLRCIATDDTSSTAQDDITITVSQAPDFVTVASVNDSTGWTPTGGTVQQVLSDTSDSTLITSIDNPTEQVLDLTMGAAVVAPGQHWTQRVRCRRGGDAATGTMNGHLYVGSTLHSTVTGRSVPGSMSDVDFTFPAGDLTDITPQQWTDGVRFVVEVTATT